MQTIFMNEAEALGASAKDKIIALNKRCCETRLCVRQDTVQQQLVEEIRVLLRRQRFCDPTNAFTYDQNLAMVEADVDCEKSHLELVA